MSVFCLFRREGFLGRLSRTGISDNDVLRGLQGASVESERVMSRASKE